MVELFQTITIEEPSIEQYQQNLNKDQLMRKFNDKQNHFQKSFKKT